MNREFEVEELSNCPICGSDNLKYIMTGYDDRFGQPDEFDVVECQVCGLGFLKQLICAEELPKLYDKYYWREDSSQSSQQLAKIKNRAILYSIKILRQILDYPSRINIGRLISPGKSVLEIGCGPASQAEDYINRGLRWTGLEIDYRMCEKIRARGLTCIHGTIEDIVASDDCRFDVIIGSQVLEHIIKPRPFLRACARALKMDGQLIFSIPNYDAPWRKRAGRNWLNWHIPYHRFYYNQKSLKYLAQIEGFSITRCVFCTPFGWVMKQKNMIAFYPERGEKNKQFDRSYNSYDKISAIVESWKQCISGTGEAIIVEMHRS